MRVRVAYWTQPSDRIVLADTARPDCARCHGKGFFWVQGSDPETPDEADCDCFTDWWHTVLRFPAWAAPYARRAWVRWQVRRDGWSGLGQFGDEPPF